jgi:hypothetical protein
MVKSKINPENVNYIESKELEQEDMDYSSPMYDYKFKGKDIVIALGKQRHTFSKYDIVYLPIYLIVDEFPREKIGIFEVSSNKLIDVLDDDGDVKLSNKYMLFFVDKKHIEEIIDKYEKEHDHDSKSEKELDDIEKNKTQDNDNVDISKDEDVVDLTEEEDVLSLRVPEDKKTKPGKEADETLKDGIFIVNDKAKIVPTLQEETKEDSQEIKQEFKEAIKNTWIEKMMKNNNYDIIDNEGGGDCFFAVIRDAFKQVGKETTVDKLRALLSKEATDKMFQESRTIYTGILAEYQEKEKELKDMTKTISLLKKRLENSKNKKDSDEIVEQSKKILEEQKLLKVEKKGAKDLLDEFDYMENLTTLEKFREFMLTRHYWADTWAISTIERLLNVKVVLLSEEAFKSGDLDSVMQCGQLNDLNLEEAGSFIPDYYIMACYTGNHYKLISYKEKHIFKFREIPYDVKIMIINKCLEKNSGPYYLIQDFRNMKTKLGLHPNEGEPEETEDEFLTRDLHVNDVVFSFHSKADGTPKPGKGSGESIKKEDAIKYKVLASIKDWRRKLEDSWITPFTLDGHRWNSVEHYFLAAQFKKGFPDFYLKFSVDSGTDFSKDVELARIAGSKTGKTKDRVIRDAKITMDPNFYTLGTNPIFEVERKNALAAKFSGNLELKNMLLETKDAKLVRFERSKGHKADTLLMKIRKELRKTED